MITTTLKELEAQVQQDSEKKDEIISRFRSNLAKRGLNKGRLRPKDPTEEKILASFSKK